MKILVGNNAMADPGGSETYSYAIIKELIEQGHEVECVTKRRGMVSRKLADLGVPVYTSSITGKYDIALLSHSTSIALSRNVKAFKIQTCHGVYPKLEQPVGGMDAYISISEEVQDYLKVKKINSTLIRNGIDCERFKPIKSIKKKVKTILSLSHSEELNQLLYTVCANAGIKLIIQNKYKKPIWDIESIINEVDLVVSLGRGAYEAMACGRNVLILDNRGYVKGGAIGDGLATHLTLPYFLKNNCSGRFTKKSFVYNDLVVELFNYSKKNGNKLRKFVLQNLNIKKQVNQYLSLVK